MNKTSFKGFKRHNAYERQRTIFYYAMILLPLLQVGIFYFGVNINSILLSFKTYNSDLNTWSFVGFDNFKQAIYSLFNDSSWRFGFQNSMIAFVAITLSNLVLSVIFSFYIFKKGLGSNFFRVMLYLPSILSGIVMVILYRYFVDVFLPEVSFKLNGIQVDGLMSNPNTKFFSIILFSIIIGFGTNVLLLSGAMSSVPQSLIEAAIVDGANEVQQLLHVIFPQIFSTFVTILIVAISGFFTNQLSLFSFFGSYAPAKLSTIGYILFKRTQGAVQGEYPLLATYGLIFTFVIVPITLIVRKVLEKVGPSNE